MSLQLNGKPKVFRMETLRWVTNHLILLFWKVQVPFWIGKVVSQKVERNHDMKEWAKWFYWVLTKKLGDGRFTVLDKKLQPYRAWYWSLKCWTSHVLETLGSTCRTNPEAILIHQWCSIFFDKVSNYQGWGVGGSHNYDKISGQSVPKSSFPRYPKA